jgi:hypothetical protein
MTTGADGGAAITALLGHPDHRSVCGEAGVEQSIDHLLQVWCSDSGDNCAKCLAQSGVFHGRHRETVWG